MKNKYYRYVLITLLSINIILLVLKHTLDITLYCDWYDEALWIIWVLMIIMYPCKKCWDITIGRIIGMIGILFLVLVVYLYNDDIGYGIVHSPNNKNHVILKGYRDLSLHHPYFTVDIYERIGWIFKRPIGQKIYAYKKAIYVGDGIIDLGSNRYKIEYHLYLEWLNDNVLHVYCDSMQIRDDEILDITVNLEK